MSVVVIAQLLQSIPPQKSQYLSPDAPERNSREFHPATTEPHLDWRSDSLQDLRRLVQSRVILGLTVAGAD